MPRAPEVTDQGQCSGATCTKVEGSGADCVRIEPESGSGPVPVEEIRQAPGRDELECDRQETGTPGSGLRS